MKYIYLQIWNLFVLTEKDKVGDEVTLLEFEWLKLEEHFIIQESKFQNKKTFIEFIFWWKWHFKVTNTH